GVRSVEIGTLMFGAAAQLDLVRLAIPRRTYTQSHMDYLLEVILAVFARRDKIRGLVIEYVAPYLRHFTTRLRPLALLAVRKSWGWAKSSVEGKAEDEAQEGL